MKLKVASISVLALSIGIATVPMAHAADGDAMMRHGMTKKHMKKGKMMHHGMMKKDAGPDGDAAPQQ